MKGSAGPQSGLRDTLTGFSAEGMVYVSTIRAPVAKGAVRGVELPRLPAGYRLILPADIPGRNSLLSFGAEIPILAAQKISYRGEPVALVAGPDPLLLDELAARARVSCEEEEAAFSWESFSPEQIVARRVAISGDPDLAFSIAGKVVSGSYLGKSLEHYYSEPQGAAASFDYDKMAVWCATQWPYHVRDSVANALGCGNTEVSVRPTRLGVHLDGKLWYPSLLSCHAAIASVAMGRPAKIQLTREEDFRFTPKRARS